jgi:hypothetical protein
VRWREYSALRDNKLQDGVERCIMVNFIVVSLIYERCCIKKDNTGAKFSKHGGFRNVYNSFIADYLRKFIIWDTGVQTAA